MSGGGFADQAADKIILGRPPQTADEARRHVILCTATELAIQMHCRDLADQRLLTEALGLASYERSAFATYMYGRQRGPQVAPMLAHAPARRTATKRRG